MNDIKKLSPLLQTSCLEGYHSLLNHWHPKMLCFSYIGTKCRLAFDIHLHMIVARHVSKSNCTAKIDFDIFCPFSYTVILSQNKRYFTMSMSMDSLLQFFLFWDLYLSPEFEYGTMQGKGNKYFHLTLFMANQQMIALKMADRNFLLFTGTFYHDVLHHIEFPLIWLVDFFNTTQDLGKNSSPSSLAQSSIELLQCEKLLMCYHLANFQ